MNILLTGSVAFDYLMTFPGYFRDHILPDHLDKISLSFLVDSMVRLRGGVAPNIAYTLALLGGRPRLWATVGEDFEDYRRWLDEKGVDTSGAQVIPGEYTASFFANTDRSNAQIASFYPGAMAHAGQLSLSALDGEGQARPDLVMISPNDPYAMNRYVVECQNMGLPYVYDPSQQIVRLTAEDLHNGIEGALGILVNDYEYALIQKATGIDPAEKACQPGADPRAFLAVTQGKDGVIIYTAEGTFSVPVVPPTRIVDPTGVGDAFRGGFLTGYDHHLDWETCGRMGVLAATYCLEQRGPQGHAYTPAEFVARFRLHFDDQGKLDVIIKG